MEEAIKRLMTARKTDRFQTMTVRLSLPHYAQEDDRQPTNNEEK